MKPVSTRPLASAPSLALALVLASSCNGADGESATAAEPTACEKMDILFVIDDSGSMAEEQANLIASFPQFINVLNSYTTENGDPLDYRIGVTTTGRDLTYNLILPFFPPLPVEEMGNNGALLQGTGCGMTRPWIQHDDDDVSGTFACVGNVGTLGSSIEMPLYAAELSFTARVDDGTNAGFRRDDALLAIVVLTDEDDCSREDDNFDLFNEICDGGDPMSVPTSDYVSLFDDLTGSRDRWAAAIIAGQETCSSSFGDAVEASRLKEFVGLAGSNAVFSSICDGDLAPALQEALDTFDLACGGFADGG